MTTSKHVQKKGIGLVLGGGAARGFYHVGVIIALQKLKVPINAIAGTSAGALVGAMFASDPGRDFSHIVNNFDLIKLLKLSDSTTGIIDTEKIERYLHSLIPCGRFEELKIQLYVNATDMSTAEEVVFDSGELFLPIIASMSIPGVFPALKYKGKFLGDGGLVNILPVSLLKSNDRIIISDVSPRLRKICNHPTKMDMLKMSIIIPQKRILSIELAKIADKEVIHLKIPKNMDLVDFRPKSIKNAVKMGYDAVMRRKKKILSMT